MNNKNTNRSVFPNKSFSGGPGGRFFKKAPLVAVILCICVFVGYADFDAAGVAENNRGVGLMGQFNYEAARRVFEGLVKKYPKNLELRVNLGIATFNRQREGDEKTALTMFRNILEQDGSNLRARYCSGLLELHSGRPAEALEYFQSVLKAEPGDAEALYFTGKTLMQLSRYPEALDYFKRTVDLDPYLRSGYYNMIMCLRQMGKMDEAAVMIKEFQRLRENPRARTLEFKYTMMGRKAEVLAINQGEPEVVKKPSGPLFGEPRKIGGKDETFWRSQVEGVKGEIGRRPGITVSDINGDGRSDIFIAGAIRAAGGMGNAILSAGVKDGEFVIDAAHPLAAVTGVNAALWGDWNDDGRVDVYLCRKGPNRLMQQDEGNKWRDITKDTGTDGGDFDTVDGAFFDADHDGDLDLFLVNADGANELLNNNRDGSFRPLADKYGLKGNAKPARSIIVTDLDTDRDADIIVINAQPPHEVYINERLWNYSPGGKTFASLVSADILAAVSGDVDTDGRPEIYGLDGKGGLHQWRRNDAGVWEGTVVDKNTVSGKPSRLVLADVDGDGGLDVLLSGLHGWRAASFNSSGLNNLFTFKEKYKKTGYIAAGAVLNTTAGPAMVTWTPGRPPLLRPPGPGRYGFALITLSGMHKPEDSMRSNASGIGTRVSFRVGSRWTVKDTFRNDSGPGQSLQPMAVGLGGAERIDFAAIDWSDGVFQTEMGLDADKLHALKETQRQLSSCPVLFAWNGKEIEFVSDFLGVGGMGYAVAPGEYSVPRPWENFMFPSGFLQPRDGRYIVKITEPMEEAAYLDSARLKAYDLPPGWSMTLDERMGIMGPAPTGRPVFYRDSTIIHPVKAVNDRHEDVTASIKKNDLKAAPPGPLDVRFIGRLERDHVLTVTFERPVDSYPGQPVLVADGWVEYPYSQTNFAMWQAGADLKAPTIEVRRPDGQWEVLLEQFGYPAGMPRQMSVPLDGLPQGVQEIRIRTNQEIYWDRLAVVFAEPCPEAEHHTLPLASAVLEQTGFPRWSSFEQHRPYYDYSDRRPFGDMHFLEGYYTRLGRVDELVQAKDNGLVIFAVGEGVSLEFEPLAAPPAPQWTRVFVLETEGWCKDMDLFTRTGDTVEPVPGKRTPEIERLHKRYNTRYLSGKY